MFVPLGHLASVAQDSAGQFVGEVDGPFVIAFDAFLEVALAVNSSVELPEDVGRLNYLAAWVPRLHEVWPLPQFLFNAFVAVFVHARPVLGEINSDADKPRYFNTVILIRTIWSHLVTKC